MTTSKAPAKPRAPRKASAEAKPSTKPAIKAAAKSSTEPAKASAKPRSSRVVKEKAAVKPIATQAPANIAAAPAARSRSASRSATATVDRKNAPISEFTLANIRHDTRVSSDFLIYELTRSELADIAGRLTDVL